MLHFGSGYGNSNGNFRAICNIAQTTTTITTTTSMSTATTTGTTTATTSESTNHFVDGSNCGQGLGIVSSEACKAAVDALGITYKRDIMKGKWTHAPPRCFVHKGCTQDCVLHFGSGYACYYLAPRAPQVWVLESQASFADGTYGCRCVCSECKPCTYYDMPHRDPQMWVLESQASFADGQFCPKSEANCIDCSAQLLYGT